MMSEDSDVRFDLCHVKQIDNWILFENVKFSNTLLLIKKDIIHECCKNKSFTVLLKAF